MDKEKREIEYLSKISSPEDLKALPKEALGDLAKEIRAELVRIVSANGGHLASNLGVVEMTLAIHRVFETPKDHVIFDVGHQSYVHKMLTGRYGQMDTLRCSGGISGFMKRDESEYDCFGAGHSSTSLSAALGFAISDKIKGTDSYTVAVVGDGAFTGGMIHEAINNCRKDLKLIILLNENEMSISKNIGRFAIALSKLRASSGYLKTKRRTSKILKKIPFIGKYIYNAVKAMKKLLKKALYGSNYFEGMGLTYLGPIDGNNYAEVENMLTEAKNLNESVIVHLITKKGKGYAPAEENPSDFHGIQPEGCESLSEDSFSVTMGRHLTTLGAKDKRICAITAAMTDGTGLGEWEKAYPDRFFDVGIAEGHALTFASGLAANGMKPCAAIYSTFLQRSYDNIIHDVALQNLPVVMAIDRTGLNPNDGATHHGIFDVAFLSHIPGIKIYAPITREGLCRSLDEAFAQDGPCAIRYPSGEEDKDIVDRFYYSGSFDGLSERCDFDSSEEKDILIVTYGKIVKEAMEAADLFANEGIKVGIALLEVLKPYDVCADRLIDVLPEKLRGILFLEEGIRSGGMGMNLADIMNKALKEKNIAYDIAAIDDSFVSCVKKDQTIYDAAGISKDCIYNKIKKMLKK